MEHAEQQLVAQQTINNQLSKQLQEEKQRIDNSTLLRQKELSEALAQLKTMKEQVQKSKDVQIAQLSA